MTLSADTLNQRLHDMILSYYLYETMTDKEKERIGKILGEILPNPECSMCHNRQMMENDSCIK